MYGEDFLGLRELGITSELGVSTLSVPKKLLRAKGTRMGAGSSLPYVEPALDHSARLFTYGTSVRHTETSRWNLRHRSRPHLRSSHSSQRGWKTKLLDSYGLSTSLVSMPSHNLKPVLPNLHSPPRMVLQRCTLPHPNLYHPSQASCYIPFQRYRNRPCSTLHNINHRHYSPFRTIRQARPKRRWDLSGRSLAGNRRTPPRRRNRKRRKNQRSPALAAAASMES